MWTLDAYRRPLSPPLKRGRDARFMCHALSVAQRHQGQTWPNPAVGAVIVAPAQNGQTPDRILGCGVTAIGGIPHAETVALAHARQVIKGMTSSPYGQKTPELKGAWLYVTLEPCAHQGRTPPCCEAIIAAGIARVIIGMQDPDPRVSGRGIAQLRAAGVPVEVGLLKEQAQAIHAGHSLRHTQNRPWVTLKMAISDNGMIGRSGKGYIPISGALAHDYVQLLRATHDAVMIGSGTARSDNPRLTCRRFGLESHSPLRVVLDSQLTLSEDSRLVQTANLTPVLILTAVSSDAAKSCRLKASGCFLHTLPENADHKIPLKTILSHLAQYGITRLLVEGGGALAKALLAQDLVDQALFIHASRKITQRGIPFIDTNINAILSPHRYDLDDRREIGDDQLLVFRRKREL